MCRTKREISSSRSRMRTLPWSANVLGRTLSRSISRSSPRTTPLSLGTITATPNPCFSNMHWVSCDSSDTSLDIGSKQERATALQKLKTSLFTHFGPRGRVWSRIKFAMHEVKWLVPLEWMKLKGRWTSPYLYTLTMWICTHWLNLHTFTKQWQSIRQTSRRVQIF